MKILHSHQFINILSGPVKIINPAVEIEESEDEILKPHSGFFNKSLISAFIAVCLPGIFRLCKLFKVNYMALLPGVFPQSPAIDSCISQSIKRLSGLIFLVFIFLAFSPAYAVAEKAATAGSEKINKQNGKEFAGRLYFGAQVAISFIYENPYAIDNVGISTARLPGFSGLIFFQFRPTVMMQLDFGMRFLDGSEIEGLTFDFERKQTFYPGHLLFYYMPESLKNRFGIGGGLSIFHAGEQTVRGSVDEDSSYLDLYLNGGIIYKFPIIKRVDLFGTFILGYNLTAGSDVVALNYVMGLQFEFNFGAMFRLL